MVILTTTTVLKGPFSLVIVVLLLILSFSKRTDAFTTVPRMFYYCTNPTMTIRGLSSSRNDNDGRDGSNARRRTTTAATTTPSRNRKRRQTSPSKHPQRQYHSNQKPTNKNAMVRRTDNLSTDKHRQMNGKITQQETAMDILSMLSSQKGALTSKAGGGTLNSINFSTSFHRIAKHIQNRHRQQQLQQQQQQQQQAQQQHAEKNDRSKVLSDPRFAFLLCSAAEALVDDNPELEFGAREMSNMAWALAKLKIVPPQTAMPLDLSEQVETKLGNTAAEVRALILQVAKERQQQQQSGATSTSSNTSLWIPKLSELTGLLLDTFSRRVVGVHSDTFRLQEWANLLWALATCGRGDAQVFTFILSSLVKGKQLQGDCYNNNNNYNPSQGNTKTGTSPQEWSNSVWALATAGILGPEEDFLPFVAQMMENDSSFVAAFKPQELSNTLWGMATIINRRPGQPSPGPFNDAALTICRHLAKEFSQRQGQGFKTQEVANTAWAIATVGFGLKYDAELAERSDYKYLQTDNYEQDAQIATAALRVAYDCAKNNLRRYRSQELNNLSWVTSRVDVKDFELLEMVASELANPRRKIQSQDLGTTLWGMASSKLYNAPDLYRGVAARWTPAMAALAKPQELSNTVWALATADVVAQYPDAFDTTILSPEQRQMPSNPQSDPVLSCFALAAQEVMRRPHAFKTQEIKDILWAFSSNGIRHPQLFRAMAEHLMGGGQSNDGRGLKEFSIQAVGNTAWAFARQAQLGADAMGRFKGKTKMPRCSGRLAHYMVMYTDVGEELLQQLFDAVADMDLNTFDNMKRLKPQDVTNTAWAFGIVGIQHTKFLDAVAVELERRTRSYETQEITNGLWALATMNHCPQNLLHRMEQSLVSMGRNPKDSDFWTTRSIASVWKRQELANMAWICAVFGEYPPDLVRMIYMGLVGVGDNPDPDVVTDCYVSAQLSPDEGITPTAIMSLTYLQILLDLDSDLQIHLPADFPDAWLRKGRGDDNSSRIFSGPSPRGAATTAEAEGLFELKDNSSGTGDTLQLQRSGLQQIVSAALTRVGFEHVEEYVFDMTTLSDEYGLCTARSGADGNPLQSEVLSLDMANVAQRIGIEVDGPAHFVVNIDNMHSKHPDDGYVPTEIFMSPSGKLDIVFGWNNESKRTTVHMNGPTSLKLRILQAMGWEIHNIPFWEWSKVEGDKAAEEEYCRSLLNKK